MKSPAEWRGLNWRALPGLAGLRTRIERQPKTERLLPRSALGPFQGSGNACRPCLLFGERF